jgi:hypothetical protein
VKCFENGFPFCNQIDKRRAEKNFQPSHLHSENRAYQAVYVNSFSDPGLPITLLLKVSASAQQINAPSKNRAGGGLEWSHVELNFISAQRRRSSATFIQLNFRARQRAQRPSLQLNRCT